MIFLNVFIVYAQEVRTAPYAFFKEGKYRKAIESADELIKIETTNISAYAVKGWALLSLQQWKNALETGLQAERINQNDPRILQIIGESYFELKDDKLALQYFSKYLTISPNGQLRNWVYYFLGNIYKRNKQLYKADVAYNTALMLNPNKVQWMIELGEVYELLDNKEKAKEIYRKALAFDSNNNIVRQRLQKLLDE